MLDKGAAVHESRSGETGLLIAVRGGFVEVVKVLLEHGACVDDCNYSNETPLFLASKRGDLNTVDILLQNGASVEISNYLKELPIYVASKAGYFDVVKALVVRLCVTWKRPRSCDHPDFTETVQYT